MAKHIHGSHSYTFSLILIAAISLGGLTGYFSPHTSHYLKPFSEIFLNLIFTAIIPLVFFSIASAIVRANSLKILGKITLSMALVFLFTGLVAAIFMLVIVKLFPPAKDVAISLTTQKIAPIDFSNHIAGIFSVPDFSKLLYRENMIALIVFSVLVGLAVPVYNKKGKLVVAFLQAGEETSLRVFHLIMYFAPLGFFSYFASLVNELGPKIMANYFRIAWVYYLFSSLYFIIASTGYAFLAGKMEGVKLFWKNIFLPMITAIATCSSAASIPANLIATKKMHVSSQICETAIPLGSIIHKEGSIMGGIIKIAFLFGIFHLNFTELSVLFIALGVSLLVGTVMGAIPSGGMLGELLILNIYGFPSSALMVIAAISIIIDPPATMLNVTGNSVSSMMIARLVDGKKWHSATRM